MTREEIENTPTIVDYLLDESVTVDSREKLHKRLHEVCNLAKIALEQEPCEISKEALEDMEIISKAAYEKMVEQVAELERIKVEPCDNSISRQAAIDALKIGYWDKNIQSTKNDPCVVDAMIDWAIRRVKALPSVSPARPTGWIPISDGLPDLNDYIGKEIWEQQILITGYFSFDDNKKLFTSKAYVKDVINNNVHDTVVVAWMPLPEPYKEKEYEREDDREYDEQ